MWGWSCKNKQTKTNPNQKKPNPETHTYKKIHGKNEIGTNFHSDTLNGHQERLGSL